MAAAAIPLRGATNALTRGAFSTPAPVLAHINQSQQDVRRLTAREQSLAKAQPAEPLVNKRRLTRVGASFALGALTAAGLGDALTFGVFGPEALAAAVGLGASVFAHDWKEPLADLGEAGLLLFAASMGRGISRRAQSQFQDWRAKKAESSVPAAAAASVVKGVPAQGGGSLTMEELQRLGRRGI